MKSRKNSVFSFVICLLILAEAFSSGLFAVPAFASSTGPDESTDNSSDIVLPIDPFHSLSCVPAKGATCTEEGNTVYYSCSECGKWFEDSLGTVEITDKTSVVIPAKGHTPGNAVTENETPATCSAVGSYDEVVYCTVCHAEISRTQKTIQIDGDAHEWNEWTQTKAPTETEKGEEKRTCKLDPSHFETRDIPMLVHTHDLSLVPAKDATCTEAGNKPYYVCSGCSKIFTDPAGTVEADIDDVTVAAPGHDWGEWTQTKAPTKTEKGEEKRTCRRDPSHFETREIPPLHDSTSPKTGGVIHPVLWVMLAVLPLAGLVVTAIVIRKKRAD
ncbi:MAG: hypothetical protein IJU20_03890 [Clostridia bacterium]|nr:hypothetical protein [Clostridia bacterium]